MQSVVPDGLVFDESSVKSERIAEGADYHGVRAKFWGHLGHARIPMQIDIGFSDVVTPGPVRILYPALLDYPRADLYAYNFETLIAEKFEAMISLGTLNSRMKDFFDIWALSRQRVFVGADLSAAIASTFARREATVSTDAACFQVGFASDPSKTLQWSAFLRNARLTAAPRQFSEVTCLVREFLQPVAMALESGVPFAKSWPAGGPWQG